MGNIRDLLNKIRYATYGKEVRQSIHDAIEECYATASVDHDNANMEVKIARGTHNTLNDRLVENEKKQENLSSQLEHIENNKTDKTTTQNLQTQVNNLVLASDGTQNAEVVQARGGFPVLNSRLDNIESTITDLNIKRFNLFNKEDITLNKYFGGTIGTSTVNNIGDTTNSFISNQSFKVKKGDVIKVNQQYVGIYIYDNNGILREKYNDTKKEFTVQSDSASFFKISYGKYNDGKIDTLMVVVNDDMQMEYVSFNNISMTTEETKDLYKRVEILENKSQDIEKKAYILLNFDDSTNMYKNRFEIMKEYGFKFSFCLNSGIQVSNNFSNESEKSTFFEMLNYGCDVTMYGGDRNTIPVAVADRTKEQWKEWVNPLLASINNLGIYPVTYFTVQNNMTQNGIDALKELGFKLCRSGLYNPENNYRWIESFDDNRFNTPCVQIQNGNLETVKEYIDTCITNKYSISIFTHQVVDNNTSDLNCDTIVFRQLLDYIKEKVDSGLCEVVTYQEFLNKMTVEGKNVDEERKNKRLNFIQSKLI